MLHLQDEVQAAQNDGKNSEGTLSRYVLHLQDEVQAAQNDKAAAEDSSSRVTFEVEVLHFQVYLQAEMAPGRFLLAAEKGRVEGRSMPHLFHNLISLTLDQVSAAVM